MTAFNYEQKENISYFEKMLIANDEDKLNSLKIKSDVNMLEKTQLHMCNKKEHGTCSIF